MRQILRFKVLAGPLKNFTAARRLHPVGSCFFFTEGTSVGGVIVNMMNRKSTRVLISLVLAAAICTAIGTEAHAARLDSRSFSTATIGSKAPRPGTGPMMGEPDVPNGQLPPKTGFTPTGGQQSSWALRVHWLVRTWLGTVPKRFP